MLKKVLQPITIGKVLAGLVIILCMFIHNSENAEAFTANYDANGGSGSYSSDIGTTNYTLPSMPSFSRTGYVMETDAGGTHVWWYGHPLGRYLGGTTLWASANYNFYVNWIPVTQTVYFNNNGGLLAAPAALTGYDGDTKTLPGYSGTKAGYIFGGWNTNSSGTGTNYLGGSGFPIVSYPGNSTTLYVKWDPQPYTITFNSNGGTAVSSITLPFGSSISAPAAPTRTGYTFASWSPVIPATMPAVDTTVTAQWNPILYTVTYNANGSTSGSAPASQTKTYNVALTLRTNTGSLAKTGYNFAGWNTAAAGNGTDYAVGVSYTTDDAVTLYAKWTIDTYAVTYNANGSTIGTVPGAQTKTYNVDLTLQTNTGSLEKTGYTFAGWNTAAAGNGTDYAVGVSYTTDAAVTLYAKWTTKQYQLTYYNSSAHEVGALPATQTANYNTNVIVSSNTGNLQRTGYAFGGWNTVADGSGTQYSPGNLITILEDTKLYATWKTLTIALNFAREPDNPSDYTINVNYNQDIKYTITGELTVSSSEPSLEIPNVSVRQELPSGVTVNNANGGTLSIQNVGGVQVADLNIATLTFNKTGVKWTLVPKTFSINVTYQTLGNKVYDECKLLYNVDGTDKIINSNSPLTITVKSLPTTPILDFNGYIPGQWTKSDVEISIDCERDGVAVTKFLQSADGGATWYGTTVGSAIPYLSDEMQITTEVDRTLTVKGIDTDGTESPPSPIYTIKIDKTPAKSDGITQENTSQTTGNLTITDRNFTDAGSGVDRVEWRWRVTRAVGVGWGSPELWNNGVVYLSGADAAYVIPMDGPGLYDVERTIYDNVGNKSLSNDSMYGNGVAQFIADSSIIENVAKIKINAESSESTAFKVSIATTQNIKVDFSSDSFTPDIPVNIDIRFVIDNSGSMSDIASGTMTRLDVVKDSLKTMLDELLILSGDIEVSIITFNSRAQKMLGGVVLDSVNVGDIKTQIDTIIAGGGTNMGDGLRLAYYDFDMARDSIKYIFMFSDGEPTFYSYTGDPVNPTYVTDASMVYNTNAGGNDYVRGAEYAFKIIQDKIRNSPILGLMIGDPNLAKSKEIGAELSPTGLVETDLSQSSIISAFETATNRIKETVLMGYLDSATFTMQYDNVNIISTDNPKLTISGNKITGNLRDMKFAKTSATEWQLEPYSFNVVIGFTDPGVSKAPVFEFKYYSNFAKQMACVADVGAVQALPAKYRVNYPPEVNDISKDNNYRPTKNSTQSIIPLKWQMFKDKYDDGSDTFGADQIKEIKITDLPKANGDYAVVKLKRADGTDILKDGILTETDFTAGVQMVIDLGSIDKDKIQEITLNWKASDGYDYSANEAILKYVVEYINIGIG